MTTIQSALAIAAMAILLTGCGATASSGATSGGADASPVASDESGDTPGGPVGGSGAASPSGELNPCGPNDIEVEATDGGGAAGSRGADVSITAIGEAKCRLPSSPMVALLDPSGKALLQTPITVDSDGPVVSGDDSVTFTYEFSNWCAPTTATPLVAVIATAIGTIPVTGIQYGPDDLPPCNGPGQPAQLTTSAWVP
jgi:Protein of unknown function (DUF4232)